MNRLRCGIVGFIDNQIQVDTTKHYCILKSRLSLILLKYNEWMNEWPLTVNKDTFMSPPHRVSINNPTVSSISLSVLVTQRMWGCRKFRCGAIRHIISWSKVKIRASIVYDFLVRFSWVFYETILVGKFQSREIGENCASRRSLIITQLYPINRNFTGSRCNIIAKLKAAVTATQATRTAA